MIFVSIEGNIGSGKSTTLKELKKYFKNEKRIVFLEEPVDTWMEITDSNGKNMLEKYYADTKKYAFTFQMMAYISRIAQIKKVLETTDADIIVSERSVHTDKNVFAKMLFDSNLLEDVEYKVYLNWFNEFIKDIPQSYAFYIKTDPYIAFERVQKRARPGETCNLDYLVSCHNYHNNWLIPDDINSPIIKLLNNDFTNKQTFQNWFYNIYYHSNKNNKNQLAVLDINGNVGIDDENTPFNIISNSIKILLDINQEQNKIKSLKNYNSDLNCSSAVSNTFEFKNNLIKNEKYTIFKGFIIGFTSYYIIDYTVNVILDYYNKSS